ncbi:hypothetical protein ACLHDG_10320 [Sulfurovum sp. CS9]|uniref:hypothetical protein n=1 Tax=Sulfurovum sp. CS9 TaxID=3391146 RepID=UPI0039ECD50A
MKMIRIMLAAILMLFVHAQAEGQSPQKEQLITPTLWAKHPDHFACNLTNVDHETHVVQVRIISNGEVLEDSEEISLEPKHTTNHTVQGSHEGGPIYCEFTVEGSKDMYRGAAKLYPHPTGTDITAIAAQ